VISLFSGVWAVLDDIGLELDWQRYFIWVWERVNPVLLIIFTILALWLLAVVGMILKYGGFTLTRTGDRIQMIYGLLQRRQVSIPVQRIQAVRLVEGVLRQPLGYLTIQVESAGYGPQSNEKAVLWPLVQQRELMPFLREFLPEFALEIPLQPLPPAARRRYALRNFLPAVLLALPAFIWLPWREMALALPPLGVFWGLWKFRDTGWGLRRNMLALRCRSLTRTTFIVPKRCVQSFSAGNTLIQRRAGLVSFSLDLASRARFGLADISRSDGETLLRWFQQHH
jgi:putative membrane protein